MKILVYCVEEMKDGNIKSLGELRTKEEAEEILLGLRENDTERQVQNGSTIAKLNGILI